MPISESQLILWSNQGETARLQQTYEQVCKALTSSDSLIKSKRFEIYLQGSYKNATNITDDCDVDVAVQANEEVNLSEFKEAVLNTLRNSFGDENVTDGKRAFKLFTPSGERTADILPCVRHRPAGQDGPEGILYLTTEGEQEVRFPKLHHQNGTLKDQRTDGQYKRLIRIFKNARTSSHLTEQGLARKRVGSSYFLESLLYNVPDHYFTMPYQTSYQNIIGWLQQADLASFVCQHEQHALFGESSAQWKVKKAHKLIGAFAGLWEEWENPSVEEELLTPLEKE